MNYKMYSSSKCELTFHWVETLDRQLVQVLDLFSGIKSLMANTIPLRFAWQPLIKSLIGFLLVWTTFLVPVYAQEVSVIGKIVARQSGDIAAQISAPVSDVQAVGGDRVSQGDVLAVFNVDDRKADLASAEAQVQVAIAELGVNEAALELEKAQLSRFERLKESAAFNASQYEDSQIEVRRLEAQLEVAKAQILSRRAAVDRILVDIERAKVTAPFDAVVVSRNAEVGDYVSAGQKLFTLVSVAALEIEADVPTEIAIATKPGAIVKASTRNGQSIDAMARVVIPIENPLTRTRVVRFAVTQPDNLAIGQSVELSLGNE